MTQSEDETPYEEFSKLVPKKGWLREYIEWTMWSEAPMVFHMFIGLSTLGAALSRRLYFDKGYYRVYPNYQVVLVAPTGKCRKTSAANLGQKLLRELPDVNILANKSTPESITQELAQPKQVANVVHLTPPPAEALIYAPELAVFLGKQKYNEGLVMLLTDLFDNPDKWESATKGQGRNPLTDVCISFVGCSTPDWLVSAIPQDAFGGGFMSRILFVVQHDTPRCYPVPRPKPQPPILLSYLQKLRSMTPRAITFKDEDAAEWYNLWYVGNKGNVPEDEKMAGYHERKPDHLLRLAMLLAVGTDRWAMGREDLIRASEMLSFLEDQMLDTFKLFGAKQIGQDQERVLRVLKSNGGTLPLSEIMRKMINYMHIGQLTLVLDTLVKAKLVQQQVQPGQSDPVYRVI